MSKLQKSEWWHLEEDDFVHLDIPTEIERHTSTRLHKSGHQWNGACPYDDCSADSDGFIVWDDLAKSKKRRHYFCRGCKRSGNIVKLLQDILNKDFHEVCTLLEIGSPDVARRPRPVRAKSKEDIWKEKQVEWLNSNYGAFTYYATHHPRAVAYFNQRGIPLEVVNELGLAYVPLISKTAAQEHPEDWKMRLWSDRILFPLPGGGFTGRTLFRWEVGMDENEHKRIVDEFNDRVKKHNALMDQKYGKDAGPHKKPVIPRWKDTGPGYFRSDVLKTAEHVTFVEGPFDACTKYAAGETDVIATGTDMVNINAIPLKICDVTLAYDGDNAGINAALNWSKQLRRKGISVTFTLPLFDDLGKDWNERYRRAGKEALQVDPVPEDILIALLEPCLCSTCLDQDIETPALPDDYETFMYCEKHHPAHQKQMLEQRIDQAQAKLSTMRAPGGQLVS